MNVETVNILIQTPQNFSETLKREIFWYPQVNVLLNPGQPKKSFNWLISVDNLSHQKTENTHNEVQLCNCYNL